MGTRATNVKPGYSGTIIQPPSEEKGAEVLKMAIREATFHPGEGAASP